jgi:hypothetical protein
MRWRDSCRTSPTSVGSLSDRRTCTTAGKSETSKAESGDSNSKYLGEHRAWLEQRNDFEERVDGH